MLQSSSKTAKKTPNRKLISATIMGMSAAAMILQSVPASAAGLGSLINNMFIASGGPGVYQAQQGMVLQGGYADIKIPSQEYNVISFAPPNLSMGCGGINLFLGSFSFISAQQFVAMLKNIGEGLISVAFYTAISTMCSHCEAILSALQQAMQDMNALTKGTCTAGSGINLNGVAKSIGQEIGNDAKDALGFNGTDSGVTSATTNNTQTPGEAMDQVGSQIETIGENAWNSLTSAVSPSSSSGSDSPAQPTSPTSVSASHSLLGEMTGTGNNTWNALRASQAEQLLSGVTAPIGGSNTSETVLMELFMSIMGSHIVAPPGVKGGSTADADASLPTSKNSAEGIDLVPNLSLDDLIQGSASNLKSEYMYICQGVSANNTSYPAYGLQSGDIHVNDSCLVVQPATLSSQNIMSVQSYVQTMLFGGTVNGVSHSGILPTLQSGGTMTANQQNFLNNTDIPILALAIKFQDYDPTYMPNLFVQAQPIITAIYASHLLVALQDVINMSFGANSKLIPPKGLNTLKDVTIPNLEQTYRATASQATAFINSNKTLIDNVVKSQNEVLRSQG